MFVAVAASEISIKMFTTGGFQSQFGYNGVKSEPRFHPIDNKRSHTNHESNTHQSTSVKSSFIKRFNPFSKSKSQTINCGIDCDCVRHESLNDKEEFASVKVLKQFWNDQIKTAKSTEHLNRNQKSATIRYFSQSNDSLNDFQPNRAEKALTLDGRLPFEEFNKFKDANFVRNKKNRLRYCAGNDVPVITLTSVKTTKYPRTDSFSLNDNHFPQVSATGGKIHWAKREDIFTKKPITDDVEMSVKSNKMNSRNSTESCETKSKSQKTSHETKKESISSSAGSLNSSVTSNTTSSTASTSRKFSFKTAPATTATYMNKRIASTSNGTKVAQIAQRFNQMIQQDATILDEVKKRGTVVLHRSGGCVFKIKEEKVDNRSIKKSNDDASDDCASLPSIGKNSTRKKSSLKKRPSIRILVESPRKDGKSGNVLSKKQLYETNIVNKETFVLKPKVPDKSERVLAKTKELKIKKLNEKKETDTTETNTPTATKLVDNLDGGSDENLITDQVQSSPLKDQKKNNFQKIYDKISFRPAFLYGKKAAVTTTKLETTYETNAKSADPLSPNKQSRVDDISKETEDELEFKPIDLNLNVYFNNENLSTGPKDLCLEEEENVKSQGPSNDVTAAPSVECKPDQSNPAVDVKPNESFLFRTQLGGKLDTACDVFIRDMLNETSMELESDSIEPAENPMVNIDLNVFECNADDENNYEIISRATSSSERTDIDKQNDSSSKDGSEENIYQSLCEVKGETESVKSYESFENYDEIAQNILDNKINLSELMMKNEDDYIFPEKAPEPPPPRKNTIPKISSPILTSTTSNLVQPDLQVPKLKLNYELKKSDSCASTTYEKIKYDQLPTLRQQLQAKLPLPPRNDQQPLPCDDENIYDTIKNGDNHSLVVSSFDKTSDKNDKALDNPSADCDSFDDGENPYKNSKNDTMSIISNCYESISLKQNYSTINQILRHAISTSTLTSEHRTNSIYGTMVGQSLTPPSDRSASDNSDEWIDLSDEENDADNVTDNRFIV